MYIWYYKNPLKSSQEHIQPSQKFWLPYASTTSIEAQRYPI